jgi:hypothetical protein
MIKHYQYMSDDPIPAIREYVAVRDDCGRFLPGTISPGRPKGRVGGRAQALQLLDKILAEDEVQERMGSALREAIMNDPVRFFKQIIMPLLPQDVKIKLSEEGGFSWMSLPDMIRMKASSNSTSPVIDVSASSVADDAGARP